MWLYFAFYSGVLYIIFGIKNIFSSLNSNLITNAWHKIIIIILLHQSYNTKAISQSLELTILAVRMRKICYYYNYFSRERLNYKNNSQPNNVKILTKQAFIAFLKLSYVVYELASRRPCAANAIVVTLLPICQDRRNLEWHNYNKCWLK